MQHTAALPAAPADAKHVREWHRDSDGTHFRHFDIHAAQLSVRWGDDIEVRTAGEQYGDGSTSRHVAIEVQDCLLDAADARAVAAALLEAAERIDGQHAVVIRTALEAYAALHELGGHAAVTEQLAAWRESMRARREG